MPAPVELPVIARHLLRFNHQSKTPFQSTIKSLYHQTTHAKAHVNAHVPINGMHVSISARIAASKGDRERILKSIERARERRGKMAKDVGERKIWEEQVYPPVGGWLV